MDHVGVVVEDLDAAIAFFAALGLEADNKHATSGEWVDRVVGLDGVEVDVAFVRTHDGHGQLELISFRTPPAEGTTTPAPANTLGLRHLAFVVDDLDAVLARGLDLIGEVAVYADMYRLCYVRGPEGLIVELAERLG
jgi:catechol 2,3-dioxygenase-like lactoylglutathione lyase family enzyme